MGRCPQTRWRGTFNQLVHWEAAKKEVASEGAALPAACCSLLEAARWAAARWAAA